MPVYDDEHQKTGTSDDELRQLTGISPDEEGAMDREAHNGAAEDMADNNVSSPGDLAKAEQAAENPNITPADKEEQVAASTDEDEKGDWKTDVDKGTKKGFLRSRRQRIGLAAAGVGAAGVIGISGLLAPTLIVNHLRELLLTKASQLQSGHSLRYRRRYIHRVGDMFTSDGRRGGKIIAEMETRGYKFHFDNGNKGKLVGITPPGAIASVSGDGVADHLNDYLEVRHPLRTGRWKTKRMEAFYGRYKVTRRPVTVRTPNDPEDPERAVNRKMAEDVAGDDIDTKVKPTDASGEETDKQRATREAKDAGHTDVASGNGAYDDIKEKLRAGTPLSELAPDELKLLQVTDRIDDELVELMQRASAGSIAGRTFKSITSLFSTADVGDKLCTVRNRLIGIQVAARTVRAVGMLRYAASFIKVADASRAGNKIDPSMFNALMKRVTATDRNGNTLGASPGMAYIIKGKFSKSKNDAFKGSFGVDGKLTGFPKSVQDATTVPGISGGSCRVIQNPVFQVGLGAVEIGAGIFSGGSTAAAGQAARTSFSQALKAGIRSMMTKKVARGVFVGLTIDLSFEAAIMMVQMYAEKSSTIPFTNQEEGGELGDILGGGAGTLNKQRSLEAGMIPATTTEYALANSTFLAEKAEQQKNQGIFARYFDYGNTDSLAFQSATSLALSSGYANPASAASTLASSPSTIIGNLFGPLMGGAYAQSDDEIEYDTLKVGDDSLATDPAGNLLPIMRADIENIDPIDNRESLIASEDIDPQSYEPISTAFQDHLEKCVYNTDTITSLEKNEGDCLAKQKITKQYKAHLAYLDMLDGLDAALFPEEIASGTSSASTPSTTEPIKGNTVNVQCAVGTIDVGEADGYSVGEKYRIRLCEIPGFTSTSTEDISGLARVNSTASGKWLQLYQQAKVAGINLVANSSFRTMAKQQSLYGCFKSGDCNNGNEAAKPGYSNHQIGFAIDIDITAGKDPSLSTCKASPDTYPTYKWLAANAPALGIDAKVLSECWHWSVGGR